MQEDTRLAVAAIGQRRIGGAPGDAHVDAEVAGFRVVEADAGAAQRTLVDDVERTRVVVEVAARAVLEHESCQPVGHRVTKLDVRSGERLVGKESVRSFRSWWSHSTEKNNRLTIY